MKREKPHEKIGDMTCLHDAPLEDGSNSVTSASLDRMQTNLNLCRVSIQNLKSRVPGTRVQSLGLGGIRDFGSGPNGAEF